MLHFHIDTPKRKLIQRISGEIHVRGWCFDDQTGLPADQVFIRIGRREVQCELVSRKDVERHALKLLPDELGGRIKQVGGVFGFDISFQTGKGIKLLHVIAESRNQIQQLGSFMIFFDKEGGQDAVTGELPWGYESTYTPSLVDCAEFDGGRAALPGHTLPEALAPEKFTAVVVPVYNAVEDLELCIARLADYTPHGVEILFVDDKSPDPRIKKLLASAEQKHPNMRVLYNDENMAFTRTVNFGLAEMAPKDVIILNSDARVTPGWIDGIVEASRSTSRVATVTPMSDRAGAFSAPKIGNDNELPPGVYEITYARAFRRRGRGLYPSAPTGNGFCMFISRACLQEIGSFDAQAFPRGYGEENDFCMRAYHSGWKNLIDDRTYVFHSRSKSFGEEKTDLMAAGRCIVDERYPDYEKLISVYREGADILSSRVQAEKALEDCSNAAASDPRILFVISTATGGTPQTNCDLMAALDGSLHCYLLRCDSKKMWLWAVSDGQQELLKEYKLREPVDPVTHRSSEYDRVVAYWLSVLDVDLVHIRHMGWQCLSLPEIARRQGRAVVVSFHDFYTLCPTVKLLDNQMTFCGGNCTACPGDCEVELWPKDSLPPLKNKWVHVWRQRFNHALAGCDAFVTTSDSARERILENLPNLAKERFQVIPHGRSFTKMSTIRYKPKQGERLRILVPGIINEAKGLNVLLAILREDSDKIFEFHVLGKIVGEHGKHKRLIAHGSYNREEFEAKAAAIRPHFGLVASIWDETWCHTLTEMWSVGLPVAVFDYPTVASRVRQSGAGWVLDHQNIPALCRQMAHIGRDAAEFDRTNTAIAKWQAGEALADNTRKMAADYFDLYRYALNHRGGGRIRSYAPSRLSVGSAEGASSEGIPRSYRIAVVGPAHPDQQHANASTAIRLWERTRNRFDRKITYLRLGPAELIASLPRGELDGAILQRTVIPAEQVSLLLRAFKQAKVPYIYEIDDNLLEVPETKDPTGFYKSYAETLQTLIAAARVVTVSTSHLVTVISRYAERVELLPNRLSLRLWRGSAPAREPDGMIRILYMGTCTHAEDLALVWDAFDLLAQRIPNLRLGLVGITDGYIPPWAERVDVPDGKKDYHKFVPWLRQKAAQFDFAIAPLEDSKFNQFKSPLKVLESGALGLPVLASDHPVYRDLISQAPGAELVYNDTQSWEKALRKQIIVRRQGGDELRKWIIENYALDQSLEDFDDLVIKEFGNIH